MAGIGGLATLDEPIAIESRLDGAAEHCAAAGARLTELRRLVLRLVLEAPAPLGAYALLDRLRAARPGAAPPTVYRALDFLVQQGLVHKVERLNAFMGCVDSGAHHHLHPAQFLICGRCGTVAEIDDHAVAQALEHAAARAGFRTDTGVVELEGVCAACTRSGQGDLAPGGPRASRAWP